jgi:histidine triad (HIT) family protein
MTIFKKIIARQIPAKIVFEDDLCLAFHDVSPQAPIHILLIPKEEIRSLAELSSTHQSLMGHLMLKASEIAKSLDLDDSGYRVVVNTGENAGQSVFHLHLHIMGGRSFTWPPG